MPYRGANQTLSEFNVIESLNLVTCKLFTFAQFYSLQCISWLLTYVSIDQAIKLYYPSRAFNKKAKNVYKVCLVNKFPFSGLKVNQILIHHFFCQLLISTLFLVNFHILIFNGKTTYSKRNVTDYLNVTTEIEVAHFECYSTNYYEFYPLWNEVHFYLYALLPFPITMISNLMISVKVWNMNWFHTRRLNDAKQQKIKKRAITNLLITVFFVVSALPEVVAFVFFYTKLNSTEEGLLILDLLNLVHFTFNAFIFLVYFVTNKVLHREIRFRLISFN